MDEKLPILLASDRDEVVRALSPGDGAKFTVDASGVDAVDAPSAAASYGVALLDLVPNAPRAMALSRRLRSANGQLEVIAIVADERAGFEAVRAGAFDFVVWPLLDLQSLWMVVAGCARKVTPVSSFMPAALGRWRIRKRLGAGGMAEVFLAEQPGSEEPVVVKCLLPEMALEREFVEMFTAEARLSATLDHPNVVKVIDFGGADGQLFMVMEYVEGRNLEQVLRSAVRLPPSLACFVAAEIARGLAYAHAKNDAAGKSLGIIHRDVNPPNILVATTGRVKLTDFGIAKTAAHRTQTTHGAMKGKLDYMSPEQVEGAPLDGRADLFALGSVLYLLLAGVHPFRATTALQTLQKIRAARCEPPSAAYAGVPQTLDRIVLRALARDPAQRYASAGDFERDLRAWISGSGDAVDERTLAAFVRGVFEADPAREAIARVPTRKLEPKTPGDPKDGTFRMPKVTNLVPTAVVPVESTSGGTTVPREGTVVSPPRESTVVREATVVSAAIPAEDTVSRDTVVSIDAVAALPDDTVQTPVPPRKAPAPAPPPPAPMVREPLPVKDASSWSGMSDDRGTVTADEPLFKAVPAKPHARARAPRPWGMYGTIAGFAAVVAIGILSRPKGNRDDATPAPTPIAIETARPAPDVDPAREETPEVSRTRTPIPTPMRTAVVATTPVRTPVAFATANRAATPRTSPSAAPSPALKIARKGTLSIWMVGGWASISIDGKPAGVNAPVVGLELPEGKHRVTLENEGLDFRREYDVVIQPGRESKLSVSLD